VGRAARLVRPGDGKAGEGVLGVARRTPGEVENEGTRVHGGDELTQVGGTWGCLDKSVGAERDGQGDGYCNPFFGLSHVFIVWTADLPHLD